MINKQAVASIRAEVTQGNLETALQQLSALFGADPALAELAQAAQVLQADFYQLKSQQLKSTIAADDARRIVNQLNDSTLQLLQQYERGQRGAQDQAPPTRSQAWRYYVAGGVVTLVAVLVLLYFFGPLGPQEEEPCPKYGDKYALKVMILPFKKGGAGQEMRPEFEIMDGLNRLIARTPQLRDKAVADVNERYNIEENYPSPDEADGKARTCSVQMIIWGKVTQSSGNRYKVDVFYKLLDASGIFNSGDTTINRLVHVTDNGAWSRGGDDWQSDLETITNLLYVVLANQSKATIPPAILANLTRTKSPSTLDTVGAAPAIDTLSSMVLADHYIQTGETDKAMRELNAVLDAYPENTSARKTRGALLAQKGDYAAAARDLEMAAASPEAASPELLKAQAQVYLKSGETVKAERTVERIEPKAESDSKWKQKIKQEIRDSSAVQQVRADLLKQKTRNQPANTELQLDAAKTNLNLGKVTDAIQYARQVIRTDPRNEEARRTIVEAHLLNEDTVKALEEAKAAERAGVKGILPEKLRTVRPLKPQ